MDVVYILGTGSVWADNELRYSLRSLEKYARGFGRVFVVGERPPWLQNIVHLPAPDKFKEKWQNSYFKVSTACRDESLSEEFLLMNDDFFFLREQTISDFPYYYKGSLPVWRRWTAEALAGHGKTALNYAVHTPFRYKKELYLGMPIDGQSSLRISPRSFYGNFYNVGGEAVEDPILAPSMRPDVIERYCSGLRSVSIMTLTGRSPHFRQWIDERLPDKSIYET